MAGTRKLTNLALFDVAADFFAVVAAYATTYLLRFESEWGESLFTRVNQFLGVRETGFLGGALAAFYQGSALRIIGLMTLTLCLLYGLRDLYPGIRFIRRRPVGWNLLVANAQALVLFYAYFYLRRNVFHPRSFFVTVLFFNVFYAVAFRAVASHFLGWVRRSRGFDRRPAALAGAGRDAEAIATLIGAVHPHGLEIVAQLPPPSRGDFEANLRTLATAVKDAGADVLLCADRDLSVGQIMRLLEVAGGLDVAVKVLSDKLDILVNEARQPMDRIHGVPLVHFDAPSRSARLQQVRRGVYGAVALVAVLVLLPLAALVALLIRLGSHGPALFVQERIGVDRRPFRMLKFRTMYDRAEEAQAQIEEFNESGGGLFKIRKDPRVTAVGRFLRRFSLDELPQLINVIRGEMTLVGPRPLPRRDFENYYEEWHYSRHSGMPGLTCLWQVSGRSDIDFHNMCILDVYYLRNQNWVLDLKIILKTLWVVLFAKGAY